MNRRAQGESIRALFDRETAATLRLIVRRLGWPRVLDVLRDVARDDGKVAGALLAVREWVYGHTGKKDA